MFGKCDVVPKGLRRVSVHLFPRLVAGNVLRGVGLGLGLLAATAAPTLAAGGVKPDFGPNVLIFNSSMSSESIQDGGSLLTHCRNPTGGRGSGARRGYRFECTFAVDSRTTSSGSTRDTSGIFVFSIFFSRSEAAMPPICCRG
jgi:hypothetical protein